MANEVVERAEDRQRGELRHVQANIQAILKIRREGAPCATAGCAAQATAAMGGRALCGRCADRVQRQSAIRREYGAQPEILKRALQLDESTHR
jgi:hypothetical protein